MERCPATRLLFVELAPSPLPKAFLDPFNITLTRSCHNTLLSSHFGRIEDSQEEQEQDRLYETRLYVGVMSPSTCSNSGEGSGRLFLEIQQFQVLWTLEHPAKLRTVNIEIGVIKFANSQ